MTDNPRPESKYLHPNWDNMGQACIAIGIVKMPDDNYALMVWDRELAERHMIYTCSIPAEDLKLLDDPEFKSVIWPASSWADYKQYELRGEKSLWMDDERWGGGQE